MKLLAKAKNSKRIILLHIFLWIFFICCGIIPLLQNRYQFGIDFFVEWFSYILLFYLNYIYLTSKLLFKKEYALYFAILLFVVLFFTVSRLLFFVTDFQEVIGPKIYDHLGNKIILKKMLLKNAPFIFKIGLSFPYLIIIFISLILKTLSEYYIQQKNELIAENDRKNAELRYLRKQINPHFLFNSLNAIYALANKKSDLVTDAIVTLSELMRYMLYETDSKSVLLEKEINYIKNYIELQKLRLNDIENIHINIQGNTQNKYIEPLLLISFIENAFKFGTDYKGATRVRIKIVIKDNDLDFLVENRIEKKNVNTKNSGIGISNIENRLKLLYPDSHTLIISEEDNTYKVLLNLKLDQMQY
ncbi:MAG: histidine kinase [Flavobacterium sp.]|nr:histidine kinase [Flavobacterium sp.]